MGVMRTRRPLVFPSRIRTDYHPPSSIAMMTVVHDDSDEDLFVKNQSFPCQDNATMTSWLSILVCLDACWLIECLCRFSDLPFWLVVLVYGSWLQPHST